jgi:hypothetical protein
MLTDAADFRMATGDRCMFAMGISWAFTVKRQHVFMANQQSSCFPYSLFGTIITCWDMQLETAHVGDKGVQFFAPCGHSWIFPILRTPRMLK